MTVESATLRSLSKTLRRMVMVTMRELRIACLVGCALVLAACAESGEDAGAGAETIPAQDSMSSPDDGTSPPKDFVAPEDTTPPPKDTQPEDTWFIRGVTGWEVAP
jgi:hypothetical protein